MLIDCSKLTNGLDEEDFWYLLGAMNPHVAVFLQHPRNHADFDILERMLKEKEYSSRLLVPLVDVTQGEMLFVSKFEIADVQRLVRSDRLFAADVTLRVGNTKLHILPMNLNSRSEPDRNMEMIRVLDRVHGLRENDHPCIVMGSTGTKDKDDPIVKRFDMNMDLRSPYRALNWPRSDALISEQMLIGPSISGQVQGIYTYYRDFFFPVPIVLDMAADYFAIGRVAEDDKWGWFGENSTLFQMMVFWVPLVAIGTLLVCMLGWFIRRKEEPSVVDTESGWDTIHVSDNRSETNGGSRKARSATLESSQLSYFSQSSQAMAAPYILSSSSESMPRIQTPPGGPPPPYTETSEE